MNSRGVENPKLTEIVRFETAERLDLHYFFTRPVDLIVQDRTLLREAYQRNPDHPLYACALCMRAVIICSFKDRSSFYFRHMFEEEENDCPILTKGRMTKEQVEATKYNGAKESPLHIKLKNRIADGLRADASFEEVHVEKVWKGMSKRSWRKPDVQATRQDQRYAFEIQLSTTFLTTIVDRKIFYQDEKARLIWIFDAFNPSDARLSEDDIYLNNNFNAFVTTEATHKKSEETGIFTLGCHYPKPRWINGQIRNEWKYREITLDDLTFDKRGRAYFYDYEADRFRLEFMAIKIEMVENFSVRNSYRWRSLVDRAATLGFKIPHSYDLEFDSLTSIALSARMGFPVGYRYSHFMQVAQKVFISHKMHLSIFSKILNRFGHQVKLNSDPKSNWAKSVKTIRDNWGTPEYKQDDTYTPFIEFLIPEITHDRPLYHQESPERDLS